VEDLVWDEAVPVGAVDLAVHEELVVHEAEVAGVVEEVVIPI